MNSLTLQIPEENTLPYKGFAHSAASYTDRIKDAYNDATYSMPESSVRLPADADEMIDNMQPTYKSMSEQADYCIVVGIGGSSNGTQAVYNALYRSEAPETELIFVDTTSPHILQKARKVIAAAENKEEVVLAVVSKSGTTIETLSNFAVLFNEMQQKFKAAAEQVVAITDYASPLWQTAKKQGLHSLAIPENVGGRFSVLSPVGLFPLATAGVDIRSLLIGAKEVVQETIHEETDNMPIKSAAVLESAREHGYPVENTFVFNPELFDVGGWYRQLVGESLGKENDTNGNQVRSGMLPVVSVGTTDLHSVGQLYFGGPRNIFTTFIRAQYSDTQEVPGLRFGGITDDIAGTNIGEIMEATYQSVIESYKSEDLPFIQIHIDDITEETVGQLLQFRMLQVMYQGHMMNINAFNQPNVAGYKQKTRKILNE